jgi:methylamine dehydrogenase accessory protein MauD
MWMLLAGRLLLAAVFLVSGIAKLLDQPGSREAARGLGVPVRISGFIGLLLPISELILATLLLPSALARFGAVGAAVLLALFSVAIAVALHRGQKPRCHCFGQLSAKPLGLHTLVRNSILLSVAVFAAIAGWENSGPSPLSWLTELNAIELMTFGVAVVTLLVCAGLGWFAWNLLRQQGRLLLRIEALEQHLDHDADPAEAAAHATVPALGLPIGSAAPKFGLPRVDGELVTLEALRAGGKPVVLLFTDPDCGACLALLPEVALWQRQYAGKVSMALISGGTHEANRAKAVEFKLAQVLVQKRHEVGEAYWYAGTPSAVVVDTDGRIATPLVAGADAVRSLLEQMVSDPPLLAIGAGTNEHVLHVTNGHHHATPSQAPRVGEPAPAFALPDLTGNTVNLLASFRGRDTFVLFWNPECGFCQRMLPDLHAWEQQRRAGAPSLVLVSTGSLESNEQLGLQSSILLDPHARVMRAFGAAGTPTAILVDSIGNVASELAVGAPAILTLAGMRGPSERRSI